MQRFQNACISKVAKSKMSEEKAGNLKNAVNGRDYEGSFDRKEDYDDDDDDNDATYGPFASFSQSASEGAFLENQFKTTQLIVKQARGKTITRLKKPRDLYALNRQISPQVTQKWPSEVQIVAKKPNHLYYVPSKPELLYIPVQSNEVVTLLMTSQVNGKIVYDNSPDFNIKYFTRSKCSGKMSFVKPYYKLKGSEDTTLQFESRFESGNLMRAIRIGDNDYELWLRFDLYTSKHTQWYYFMVQNARPGIQYRFTIMNFTKSGSLYNDGMRPLIYSESDAEHKGIGWVRVGTKIKYYRNNIRFQNGAKDSFYHSLTWSCTFPNENDTYYFAHCYPYTYSDLQDYLSMLSNDPVRSKYYKQRILCRTLAGNYVYVLTITAPTKRRNEAEVKKAIVITARVHPGETNSSWTMKGLLDFLTGTSQDARLLRENFIFKIVPMLNPDGVVVGNYRCSLSGRDLNRNYKTVLKDSFPPIWHLRTMVKKLQEEREILMYCDLHGHSRKKNIFIYGCETKRDRQKRFWNRVFPAMLAKNAADKFSFSHCRFKVQKNKQGTGRVFMWNFGIASSFTLEASFCGSSLGNEKGYHFTTADYESMAHQFCDTLLDYYDPDRSKFYQILSEIVGLIKKAIIERIKDSDGIEQPDDFDIEEKVDLLSEIESDSGGSDSSVSDGLPMQLLHASVSELSRKKRLRTRKERNKRILKSSNATNDMTIAQQHRSESSPSTAATTFIKSEAKQYEQAPTNSSAKSRLCYVQRSSSVNSNLIPHFVRDRAAEKSKLKKGNLELLTAAFVSSGSDELVNLQAIPHCRFTAGVSSHYQSFKSCSACERCCKSFSDGCEEDSKLSSARDPVAAMQSNEMYWHQFGSEQNANTVLDLAKRITVYNHRLNQSVMRRSDRQPQQPRTHEEWQMRGENLIIGPSNNWDKQRKWPPKERRKFQISQEQRITGNGLFSLRRYNSHFELKRSKSMLQSRLQSRGEMSTSSSDVARNSSLNDVLIHPAARRLPQLRRSEENGKDSEATDLNAIQGAGSHNESLQSESTGSSWNEPEEDSVETCVENDNNLKTGGCSDTNCEENERNEISLLKERMLKCGASGLVNYLLSEPDSKILQWPTAKCIEDPSKNIEKFANSLASEYGGNETKEMRLCSRPKRGDEHNSEVGEALQRHARDPSDTGMVRRRSQAECEDRALKSTQKVVRNYDDTPRIERSLTDGDFF